MTFTAISLILLNSNFDLPPSGTTSHEPKSRRLKTTGTKTVKISVHSAKPKMTGTPETSKDHSEEQPMRQENPPAYTPPGTPEERKRLFKLFLEKRELLRAEAKASLAIKKIGAKASKDEIKREMSDNVKAVRIHGGGFWESVHLWVQQRPVRARRLRDLDEGHTRAIRPDVQRQFNKDLEKLVREHKDMGVDAEILDIMQQPSINRIK